MKKTYIGYSVLAAVLALSAQQANAQQGFGTDKPSKASVVEMTSGSKGLLIPRVALTSLDSFAPVSGEAPTDVDKTDALLVYNTATSDAAVADEEKVTPGYYYWTTDGTSGNWNRLASDPDMPTEHWQIQNTDTEATDNADNIYQQGKVAVGFTDADGVSDKQLEVKGDFKAQVTDGDIIYGTEIDNPLMPAQSTAHYWMNMATGAYKVATVRADAAIIESNGTATSSIFNAEDSHATMASLQKNGNAKSEIRTENIGNFFMETYNITDNYGSTISLQNDGLRMVHSETEGAGPNWLSQNNKSEIFVEKEEGVRFSFNDEDGDPKGEYWFPTTTGAAGHVLTRVGGNQTDWVSTRDMVAMPKFFYMPSIIVPTSNAQLAAPGSGATGGDSFNDVTRQGTIDLHARYTVQFGTPMVTNTTQTTTLPTLAAGALDYNITWYDINVFSAVSVNNLGVMTYTVAPGADITVGSFMNIVFAVK